MTGPTGNYRPNMASVGVVTVPISQACTSDLDRQGLPPNLIVAVAVGKERAGQQGKEIYAGSITEVSVHMVQSVDTGMSAKPHSANSLTLYSSMGGTQQQPQQIKKTSQGGISSLS